VRKFANGDECVQLAISNPLLPFFGGACAAAEAMEKAIDQKSAWHVKAEIARKSVVSDCVYHKERDPRAKPSFVELDA